MHNECRNTDVNNQFTLFYAWTSEMKPGHRVTGHLGNLGHLYQTGSPGQWLD